MTSPQVLRKELLKLNKTELVKKCKHKKLRTYGSKADLVNRLLAKHQLHNRKMPRSRRHSSMQMHFKTVKAPSKRRRASVTELSTVCNKKDPHNINVEKLLKEHKKSTMKSKSYKNIITMKSAHNSTTNKNILQKHRKRGKITYHQLPPHKYTEMNDDNKANHADNDASERIVDLLHIYNKWMNAKKKKSIYSVVCDYYSSNNTNAFFKDYNSIIHTMDKTKIYRNYKNKCSVETCLCLRRNYRNTFVLSNDNEQRLSLYYDFNDEADIVIIMLLDIVHNQIYHIFDCGLRCYDETDEKQGTAANILKLKSLKHKIKKQRAEFNTIYGDHTQNKFVSNFNTNISTDKYVTFSGGLRFYYHERYQHLNTQSDKIGSNLVDDGNSGYSICDWFIRAKYADLKTEMLRNKMFVFSVNQWKNTFLKAKLKWNQRSYVNKTRSIWHKLYGFGDDSTITLKHIICLLLYTNFDYLCSKFTASFRKWSEVVNNDDDDAKNNASNVSESDEELKRKHAHYVNWAKGLKECVEVFGTVLSESKYGEFYRGMNVKLLFDTLSVRFCGPTSSSIFQDVAINFAVDGIVLTVRNDRSAVTYFNCIPFSDFPGEGEMLFMAGFNALQIIGLKDMSIPQDYDEYIRAIRVFESCLQGVASSDAVTDLYYTKIKRLVYCRISAKKRYLQIAEYIVDLFNHLCEAFDSIQIDVAMFEQDLIVSDVYRYGYKPLSSIFFRSLEEPESGQWIKLRLLHKLLPQIKGIVVKSVDKCTLCQSTMITDYILEDIHEVLASWQLKLGISVFKPLNDIISLQSLINKHMDKFLKIGYVLQIIEDNHERYGNYYALGILCMSEDNDKKLSNRWRSLANTI